MTLAELHIKNFRCHKELFLSFSENLNYIVGRNGEGKTALLESIYYLCTTKSSSTNADTEALMFGKELFEISGVFDDLTRDEVKVIFSAEERKKRYLYNGKIIHSASEVIGKFPIVLLTPADRAITFGYPADRRKFFDSVFCQSSPVYLATLVDYNKTLRQRSSLLAGIKENKSISLNELEAWTQKLVETGSSLIELRRKYFNEFKPFVKQSYVNILQDRENPELSYFYLGGYDGENISDQFYHLLDQKKDEEIRRGISLVGPHKDDFIFSVNGIDLRTFGSQGQHKTFQVALRFAEFFYIQDKTGKTPLFLLDDVFGELDVDRAIRISENLCKVGQTFITLTDFTNISYLKRDDKDKVIKLDSGSFVYA